MVDLKLLGDTWSQSLCRLVAEAESDLLISTPFITGEGAALVSSHLGISFRQSGRLRVVVDLSPMNLCQGATDPFAVETLSNSVANAAVSHLPRLHAKVYIADTSRAIVTSGNLTSGGLYRNHEYGVEISDRKIVEQIRCDICEYADLGASVGRDELSVYCALAEQVREKYERQLRSVSTTIRAEFKRSLDTAETELLKLRVGHGAVTTTFTKTIEFLLRRHGRLSTKQMHPLIQQIHPDLCDDSTDRVINGQHFGKKWKHWVRTAQQRLKAEQRIELKDGVWRLVEH